MNYGKALKALKKGAKVAREGWNGKDMWISLSNGHPNMSAGDFWNPHAKEFATENNGSAEVLPYIIFKTADNKILMGWIASGTDTLATDWVILEEPNKIKDTSQ